LGPYHSKRTLPPRQYKQNTFLRQRGDLTSDHGYKDTSVIIMVYNRLLICFSALAAANAAALSRGNQNGGLIDDGASYCRIEQLGHPTINLNPLGMNDQDYAIGSHLNQGFDYVINVCKSLNYNDDACHEGSAVCQRHRSADAASEVYGYTGSTTLSWSDEVEGTYGEGSKVVMRMTGASCWTNNSSIAETTIEFVCSKKEFLTVSKEDYNGCSLSLTFYTQLACGSPRFSCYNGTKCVAGSSSDFSDKFGTYEGCRAECGAQPLYACITDQEYGFQCVEAAAGNYTSYAQCSNNCTEQSTRHH